MIDPSPDPIPRVFTFDMRLYVKAYAPKTTPNADAPVIRVTAWAPGLGVSS